MNTKKDKIIKSPLVLKMEKVNEKVFEKLQQLKKRSDGLEEELINIKTITKKTDEDCRLMMLVFENKFKELDELKRSIENK